MFRSFPFRGPSYRTLLASHPRLRRGKRTLVAQIKKSEYKIIGRIIMKNAFLVIISVILSVVCSLVAQEINFQEKAIRNQWRISNLENEVDKINSSVTLSPMNSKFDVVTTRTGRYAVLISDVKPYASGSKITLKIINLYAVDRSDVNVQILAIPIEEKPEEGIILANRKIVEETVGDISAGSSRKKIISIPEIRPEKLKSVTVSISEAGLRSKTHTGK